MGTRDIWMAFIDGENFTIRAQEVASKNGLTLVEGEHHKRDCFLWIPGVDPVILGADYRLGSALGLVRASYYTTVSGANEQVREVSKKLRHLGFDAHIFRKAKKEQRAKGVDIALTKDMLSHAFLGNYDIAVLVAGDGDYVPLVEEVKRLGKQVFVSFFNNGLNEDLYLASDRFSDLTALLLKQWRWATGKQ